MLVSVRTCAITVMAVYFMLIKSAHSHLPAGLAGSEQPTPHPTCILGPLCAWFVLYMRNYEFDFSTGFLSGVTKTRFPYILQLTRQLQASSFLVTSSFYITRRLPPLVFGWLHPEYPNRPNRVSFELGEYALTSCERTIATDNENSTLANKQEPSPQPK